MKTEPEDLYTAADVKAVRELLIKEQDQLCAMTGVPTAIKDFHLDHAHDNEQLVRGALHKQSNMCLGKIENLAVRYLNYWYPHGLPNFLRKAADYLEKHPDERWRHNGWIKRVQIMFNRLPEPAKKKVLLKLGINPTGNNSVERKKLFQSALLTRAYGYNKLKTVIQKYEPSN